MLYQRLLDVYSHGTGATAPLNPAMGCGNAGACRLKPLPCGAGDVADVGTPIHYVRDWVRQELAVAREAGQCGPLYQAAK